MEVTVLNRQRARRIDGAALRSFLRRVAAELPPRRGDQLTVALVSDRRMLELQREYRRESTSTDVLSFRAGVAENRGGPVYLGDIVISVPTAARQARRAGHSVGRELKLLALHGYLHLLGFDHERDGGRMLRLQRGMERRLLCRRAAREGA